MINSICCKFLDLISSNNQSDEEREILLFGITRIVEDIPKILGIIVIALLLDIVKEILIITVVIMLYKTITGGVHAKTNWGCFICSAVFYLVITYASKLLIFSGITKYGIYLIVYIFSLYTIFVYVPADVPEIPKVNMKIRKTLKVKAIIMLNIIYIISIFLINDSILQNLIIYTVFLTGIMTTRTLYNLFRTQYGYETYISDILL